MYINPTTAPAALVAQVAAAAARLGITRATVQAQGGKLSVAYTNPTGATIHTEATACPTTALQRFGKAAISDLIAGGFLQVAGPWGSGIGAVLLD